MVVINTDKKKYVKKYFKKYFSRIYMKQKYLKSLLFFEIILPGFSPQISGLYFTTRSPRV